MAWENSCRALRRNPFRAFVHSATAMEGITRAHGFRRASRTGTLAWCVDVYRRDTT